MGDLNADGLDEFVLSYRNNIRAYGGSPDAGQLWSRTVTTRGYDWNDPNGRIVSIADLDASTDSTATGADWLPEVCIMDWSENCPRLRAYHPTLDVNGAITGFALAGTTFNDDWQKANGDVAMVCGDLDADGLRLGPPGPPETVANVSQPLVILKQPSIHFDIFHDGSTGEDIYKDLCACYPDASGYQCDDFYATYTQTSSTDETLEFISKDDFAASTTLTQSVGGKFKFLTGKAERSLTLKVGAHFEREPDLRLLKGDDRKGHQSQRRRSGARYRTAIQSLGISPHPARRRRSRPQGTLPRAPDDGRPGGELEIFQRLAEQCRLSGGEFAGQRSFLS